MRDPRFDPLPKDKSKYADRFISDFVYGVDNQYWDNQIEIVGIPGWGMKITSRNNELLKEYLKMVWGENKPPVELLYTNRQIDRLSSMGDNTFIYYVTRDGFATKPKPPVASVFISYKRDESTAFALLIVERLKQHSISAFLDGHPDRNSFENKLGLAAGGEWEKDLKQAIYATECIIVLIGPETLKSKPVQNEIIWSLEANKRIIPVWHNYFDPEKHLKDIPQKLESVVRDRTGIPHISREHPDLYEIAISTLLAELGVQV